jgi:hypothetical protein
MMTRRLALILATIALAGTSAPAQEAAPEAKDSTAELAPDLKALAESCSAHKFETTVIVEGRQRPINVKLCGKEGQTDAEWLVTLNDSVKKAETNAELSPPVRAQIVAALRAEISRLHSAPTDIAVELPTAVLRPPEAAPQYSTLPPLPAPKPKTAASASAGPAPAAKKPRLTIRCSTPEEGGGSVPCASLRRETQLTIRADEDLAAGTSLRFLRGGDARADLDVGSLRSGQSLRSRLPGRVCSGVLRGKVQFQILSEGQVVETTGPYPLHCGS